MSYSGSFHNCGDLRNAHASNDAGSANRSWAHTHLHRVHPSRDESLCTSASGHVSTHYLDAGISFDAFNCIEHSHLMTVRRINNQYIHARFNQRHRSLETIFTDTDRRTYA